MNNPNKWALQKLDKVPKETIFGWRCPGLTVV